MTFYHPSFTQGNRHQSVNLRRLCPGVMRRDRRLKITHAYPNGLDMLNKMTAMDFSSDGEHSVEESPAAYEEPFMSSLLPPMYSDDAVSQRKPMEMNISKMDQMIMPSATFTLPQDIFSSGVDDLFDTSPCTPPPQTKNDQHPLNMILQLGDFEPRPIEEMMLFSLDLCGGCK